MLRWRRISEAPVFGLPVIHTRLFSSNPVEVSASSSAVSTNNNNAPASPPPRSPSFTSSEAPTQIIWQMLQQKGPLTRKQIEEELGKEGLFDLHGQAARRRLLNNKTAFAQNNRISLPSKPSSVPRSKLQPLLPENTATSAASAAATNDTTQQQPKKVLSSKRVQEVPLSSFVQTTPEFRQIAKVRRDFAFPSTHRIKTSLDYLKKLGKLETKPKPGQAVRGRRTYVFQIKPGSTPMLSPEEFESRGVKAVREARTARRQIVRDERIALKKTAWASYINGDDHRISTLLDPRIREEREAARQEKLLGLKA